MTHHHNRNRIVRKITVSPDGFGSKRLHAIPFLVLALAACDDDTPQMCPLQQVGGISSTGGASNAVGGAVNSSVLPQAGTTTTSVGGTTTTSVGGTTAQAGTTTEPPPPPVGVDVWHRRPGRGEIVDPGKFVVAEGAADRFGLVAS